MDSIHYNKIMELLDDKNTHKQISQQATNKNTDIFNKPYKKFITKKTNSTF